MAQGILVNANEETYSKKEVDDKDNAIYAYVNDHVEPYGAINLRSSVYAGYSSNSSKDIYFFIPINISGNSKVTLNATNVQIRPIGIFNSSKAQVDLGGYLLNNVAIPEDVTVICTVVPKLGIRIALKKSLPWGNVNNSPIMISFNEATLTIAKE